MKRAAGSLAIVGATLWTAALPAFGQSNAPPEEIEVVGEGAAAVTRDIAAVEEEAVWDAKRNAVERAAGIFLRARAVGREFQLEEDRIEGSSQGFIKRWEIVPASRKIETLGNARILRLQVKATVALLPVIRRLADIKDAYDDLERPRIRVEIKNDVEQRVADALIAALKADGYEIARDDRTEILLNGTVEYTPTVRLGDKESPYDVARSLAACRARLSIQLISTASEGILLAASAEGSGRSFASDSQAKSDSAESAADNLLLKSRELLRDNLLVRWARERQEGHVVAIRAAGLDAASRDLLRQHLAAMRGFRRFVSEAQTKDIGFFRILTRLDSRGLRRRLSNLALNTRSLEVKDSRGPLITCALRPIHRAAAAKQR